MIDAGPSSNAPPGIDLASRVRELEGQLQALSHSIGHDLRAPLRIAAGYLDMFAEDHAPALDEAAQATLAVVRRQVAHLDAMLQALLAFAEAGSTDLQREPIDMTLLASQAAALATDDAAATVEIAALAPIIGDRRLLGIAWRHLLDNAVKFTPTSASARIHVHSQAGPGETWFCVRDDGLGFDMASRRRLFQPLVQLHEQRRFGGVGMGLAIVRRIVERHGGRVWAESTPGAGSAFYFALPHAAPAAPSAHPAA